MESFFLAETTKYLYLLFDEDNFIHKSNGSIFQPIKNPLTNTCTVGAAGFIFNTEAHPIDVGAIHCCSTSKITQFAKDFKRRTTFKEENIDSKSSEGAANINSVFNGSYTCKARPFHKRLSVLGAFFEDSAEMKSEEKP